MRFNICSNITNGAGLQKDYELLKGILEAAGHKVHGVPFPNTPLNQPAADVNIFLEVIEHRIMNKANKNWFLPNPEWMEASYNQLLTRFNLILCKTTDSKRIYDAKGLGSRVVYTGFESLDLYRPEIAREPEFLHLAGKSETKNTAPVTEAWKTFHIPYKLTVSAFKDNIVRLCQNIPNVRHVTRFSEEERTREMNRCQFHIMPSKYEGFGHAIHEALGCGGVVITTDAAPMNSFAGIYKPLLIPVTSRMPVRAGVFNLVSARDLFMKVSQAAKLSKECISQISTEARAGFLQERENFRSSFAQVLRDRL